MPARPKTARRAKSRSRSSRTKKANPLDTFITTSAQALGLTIDPAWHAAIRFNLELILAHAKLVDEFPLDDEIEPAPVFRA